MSEVSDLKHRIECLELQMSLIKDGCQWHGDILSKKWSEYLYVPEEIQERVARTLSLYEEDVHFKPEYYGIDKLSGVYIA